MGLNFTSIKTDYNIRPIFSCLVHIIFDNTSGTFFIKLTIPFDFIKYNMIQ